MILPRLRNALLLVCVAGAAACGRESTAPGDAADAKLPADQIIYGLNHVMTKDGVREAVLRGDTAYFRETADRTDLVGVTLDFYNENGLPAGHLTSRTGEYNLRTGALTARGNVLLNINGDGRQRQIETSELHYDIQGNRIWSDKPTVSREGSVVYRGNSFTSDAKFQNVQVQGASTSGGVPTGAGGIRF